MEGLLQLQLFQGQFTLSKLAQAITNLIRSTPPTQADDDQSHPYQDRQAKEEHRVHGYTSISMIRIITTKPIPIITNDVTGRQHQCSGGRPKLKMGAM